MRLLVWVIHGERDGLSMSQLALDRGPDPATCYRLVQRLTGIGWRQVRMQGAAWVVLRFYAVCHRRVPR
jgi:hypothetical protein